MYVHIYMCVQVCWPTSIVQPLQEKWLKYIDLKENLQKGQQTKTSELQQQETKGRGGAGSTKINVKKKNYWEMCYSNGNKITLPSPEY